MASQGPVGAGDASFCRACGKPIEADARFCRFCGKPQTDRAAAPVSASRASSPAPPPPPPSAPPPPAPRAASAPRRPGTGDGIEQRLRQLFPRHHLQDDFMHIASIAVFFMALIGFVLGFFPAYTWLADNFLLGSIALVLFLILRESTLSHIRGRSPDAGPTPGGGRYQAARPAAMAGDLPAEAATTQSSPPGPASAGPGARRPPVSRA